MKYCLLICAIILFAASCNKTPVSGSGGGKVNYIIFDSCNLPVSTPISVQINTGNSVQYAGITWQYNSGYYFNGYNYIYIYGNNSDSIYIDYVDTISSAQSSIYMGYRQN